MAATPTDLYTTCRASAWPRSSPRGGRERLATQFHRAGEAELAEAATSFSAHAGGYSRDGARLIHHLEVSRYENDAGRDDVRYISLAGEQLVLSSPAYGAEHSGRTLKAIWRPVHRGCLQQPTC